MSLFVPAATTNASRAILLRRNRATLLRGTTSIAAVTAKDTFFPCQQHRSLHQRPSLEALRQDEWKRWSSVVALAAVHPVSAASAVLRSSFGRSSQQNHKRFLEILGASLLAVSTSAIVACGISSHTTALEGQVAEERNAVLSGEERSLAKEGPGAPCSTLATSALFLDPRFGMIYPATGGFLRPQQGTVRQVQEEEEEDIAESEEVEEQSEEGSTANSPSLSVANAVVDRYYDLSIRAVKGNRLSMEDAYFVAPGGRFAAVFDGHGGSHVSGYLRDNIYSLLKQALRKKLWEIDDHVAPHDDTTGSLASHVAALRSAFRQAEEHVLRQPKWDKQGSTAVAVWVHESPDTKARTVISANVGDSRAILSRGGVAVELTRDHKPNEEREKDRIKRSGGRIEWDALAKVHRVESLSLSRAIGDRFAKPIVSSEVEIKLFPVIEGKDDFILLASDGLWDVMTSQEVVTYVKERFQSELSRIELNDPQDIENTKLVLRRNMSRSLCREALRRGSGDNVCVLMVWLDDGGNLTTSSQHGSS